MDLLTIYATTTVLVEKCWTAATACKGLLGRYKNAPDILLSIRTECTAINTILAGAVENDRNHVELSEGDPWV